MAKKTAFSTQKMIFAAFLLLVGCDNVILEDSGTSGEYNTGNGQKLATPGGLRIDSELGMLFWNEVISANLYAIDVNGNTSRTATTNSYSLAGLSPGTYTFKVRALGDGQFTSNSDWSVQPPPYTVTDTPRSDLQFDWLGSSRAYSVRAGVASPAVVVIPDEYRGFPVVEIAARGFQNRTNLTSITIPDSIKAIGANAFEGCTGLTTVTVPAGVVSIGMSVFAGCVKLESISLPFTGEKPVAGGIGNITHFGFIFGAPLPENQHAFIPATLKKVIITGNSDIPARSFMAWRNPFQVIVRGSPARIGSRAFYASNLTSIVIPDSTRSIDIDAFELFGNPLQSVFFGGTSAAAWNSILIVTYNESNAKLITATRYYYAANPPGTSPGNYWHYVANIPTVW